MTLHNNVIKIEKTTDENNQSGCFPTTEGNVISLYKDKNKYKRISYNWS